MLAMVAGIRAIITSHIILGMFPFILMWGDTETTNLWGIETSLLRVIKGVINYKHQAPNYKQYTMTEITMTKTIRFEHLVIGICL